MSPKFGMNFLMKINSMNSFLLYVFGLLIHILPPTRFWGLKRTLYRMAGANIGNNVCINSNVKIYGNNKLVVGDNTWIGPDVLIICSSDVIIGKNCDIAPRVCICTGTHEININSNKTAGKGISMPISIENGCWICANSVILPGSTIGSCSIIAAGAVVKGNIPPKEIWGGIIAKFIKPIK